jgi:glycosyltransferase involved in cell wall biosynthesis
MTHPGSHSFTRTGWFSWPFARRSAPPVSALRARLVYALRPDLRTAFPLGLTPGQGAAFRDWLRTHGQRELGLTPAEGAALAAEQLCDPTAGLASTYALTPDWQLAVPAALDSAAGWAQLQAHVAQQHGPARWLTRAKPPARPDRTQLGANVLGYFSYPSGVQVATQACWAGLRAAEVVTAGRDVPVALPPHVEQLYWDTEVYPVSIINTGAGNAIDDLYYRAALAPRPGVYRIAYWLWELEVFPLAAIARAGLIDEVWAPSQFVADAVRAVWPDKPIHTIPYGITPPMAVPLPRSRFGLRADACVFLFMFDLGSVMERKNPLGLIRAFRHAFTPTEAVQLALKVGHRQYYPHDWAQLQTAIGDANIVLIDEHLSRADTEGLLATCDAYVSLHRSEGFGLSPAEAALLGKPVIATDYSSTRDFLSADWALLVDYERVRLPTAVGPYPAGSVWAEPNVMQAAAHLRWVADHRAAARALGARAADAVKQILSPHTAGQRMRARIAAITQTNGARAR